MSYDQDSTQVSTISEPSSVSFDSVESLQSPLESTLSVAVVQVVDSLPSFFRADLFGFELWQFAALAIWIAIAASLSWLFETLVSRYLRPFLKRFEQGTT